MRKAILLIIITACSLLGILYIPNLSTDIFLKSIVRKFNSKIRIAIIGSSGYIGSRLVRHLQTESNWQIDSFDRIYSGQASYEISTLTLRKYHVVIYLGGLTSRVICQQHSFHDVEQENVRDIYQLANRMLSSQVLIFASTAAIVEGSGMMTLANEDYPVQSDRLDPYTSSLWHRENLLRNLSLTSNRAPRMIGLRLGTVIGLSDSQRLDLVHMSLICQAFLYGRIRVIYPQSIRAFLDMDDLMRAMTTIIKLRIINTERFDLFHLQSFSTSIANVANEISYHTKVFIDAIDHGGTNNSFSFALDTSKFRRTFNFTFRGNQNDIIRQMIEDTPRMCRGRQSRIDNQSIPCVVCGSTEMHTILDLHQQPLANEFKNQTEQSLQCQRFPLRLVRCSKCHHTQLSYIVDRSYLFSHYLYQSGTSRSSEIYFEWLAKKIIHESRTSNGTVLEIACNDGSQLNQFLKYGWKTIGIDPAKNLAELAQKKGHTVYVGFWGVDQFSLSAPLNAIIAQNVLAHVTNPVEFLRACLNHMNEQTKLYIQTSQCEMYETGQFDTVYHEHISFFTAHSFRKIAEIVGLKIVNFEITPIHGRSCLVTFQRIPNKSNPSFETFHQKQETSSLSLALDKERRLGLHTDWFYLKFQAQVEGVRQWMVRQLTHLHQQGHTIVAYGAAAKGMVLLHFLLESSNRTWDISYVIDDAPLKQKTFCPGTSIPVIQSSTLYNHNPKKSLTIIVFAWNFWEEISQKIRKLTVERGLQTVFILLPFPQQQLFKLESNTTSIRAENIYKPLLWPPEFLSNRRPVLLISHFFNEEFLLPFWIRHHASMFDMAILIDYNSTDRSLEIIRREAPHTWKIVRSRNMEFDAPQVDAEVQDYEKLYPEAWKIALNTPEFLVHSNLRQALVELEQLNPTVKVYRFHSIILTGNDAIPFEHVTNLIKQRSQYVCNESDHAETLYSRYIHRFTSAPYKIGRHYLHKTVAQWFPNGFIAKFQYTPWPQIMNRKLQIRSRMSPHHFYLGWGVQHNINAVQISKRKNDTLQQQQQCDFRNFTSLNDEFMMIHRVWKDVVDL